ncbi:hypothetical protein OE88DRAFT_1657130 [Heliocybe sulcata]|uniref:USP domain-containing protein n=1 Tax=Heliocybe sulcata TaxID=5364 RepID=A0A5C3NI09_9AGAM|nr:hypothetical protein OE88DRAFT_1657130 [Heliocybe sulcata]
MTAMDISSAPMSPEEQENVELLISMMGGDVDSEAARRVLKKHGNDIQKAASAILEGDRAEEYGPRSPPHRTASRPEKEKDVIDLTGDEESQMTEALRMSLETNQEQTFGPSNRAPDPSWAMVPSNKPAMSSEDQTLNRAIEESLATSYSQFEKEEFFERPLGEQIRKDNRPPALRPTLPTLHYAGLVLQALYCVPQVRESLAAWRPAPPPEVASSDDAMVVEPPKSGPEALVYIIAEVFANMEFAVLSELCIDPLLQELRTQMASAVDNFGDLTEQFLGTVACIIENVLNGDAANKSSKRLFHFQYGSTPTTSAHPPELQEKSIIRIDVLGTETTSDLLSCLISQFSNKEVIYLPSDVVSFHLVRNQPPPYPGRDEGTKIFKYPKCIYMDQFLSENAELAGRKREEQREVEVEVARLSEHRGKTLNFKGKDVLSNLEGAMHFYENVIDRETVEERDYADAMLAKLRGVKSGVEGDLKAIDDKMAELKNRAAAILDDPQLQKHRYDLRAVIINEGPLGRKYLYSYTQHAGKWWKTVDWLVEEVSEEVVLNDPAGLHYGAGPYLLLYSRAMSEEEEKTLPERLQWMDTMRDAVYDNNSVLVEQLADGRAEIESQLSELGEYYLRPPSTAPSTSVEPPTPRGAMTPMDES